MFKAGVTASAGLAVDSSEIACTVGVLSTEFGLSSEAGAGASTDGVSCLLSSLADTAPLPKNMKRAATATLAAPKLYLRIE